MQDQRYALTDGQWEALRPVLSPDEPTGRPPKDHRLILDGILWILHTGAPWRDLPERFGPWKTVHGRFNRWRQQGLWDRILIALQARANDRGDIDWEMFCVDASVVRASRAAAGAQKKR